MSKMTFHQAFFLISKNLNKTFHKSTLSSLKTNPQLLQINRPRKQLIPYGNKLFVRNMHCLQPLPYPIDKGLEPLFSPETLQSLFDYQGFLINNLNKLTNETVFQDCTIFEIIDKTAQVSEHALIFNHASQAWNNDFFLQTLAAKEADKDINGTDLYEKIKEEFESIENFKEHFKNMALGIFGSGWTWLVETENDVLRVVNTYNAGTTLDVTRTQEKDPNNHPTPSSPFLSSSKTNVGGINKPSPPPFIKLALRPPHKSRFTPLLCLNMWEHAYIKDFGIQGKENYIDSFWGCINWEVVLQRTTK
ncbi:3389_t:CDS:2, partial [Funneliformis caledonium]